MNPKIIIMDGKTYHGLDEMPPNIRQKYEKLIRTLRARDPGSFPDDLEEVDVLAEVNKSLEKIMANYLKAATNEVSGLNTNGSSIPDFSHGMTHPANQTENVSTEFRTEAPRRAISPSISPAITPDTSNGWGLALVGLLVLLLCAAGAAGVWYVFLR